MVTKYLPWLLSPILALVDGEMSQIELSITQLRDIYVNMVIHNKKNKSYYCSMLCDLIV